MQPASASTALGNFADARFRHDGVTSLLHRRDDQLLARTGGPDGTLHDYPITHTFGVAPLQQYLVAFPGGRFQALEIAWDSRPAASGGQRWFHLYPDEKIGPGDALYWTGPAENWNFMCADCHSTNVRKGFDERSGGYATTFAEVSVACEACHGPGSQHVAWARGDRVGDVGLMIALDERRGISWEHDAAGKPHRSAPRRSERELEMCARCHSRRGILHEDHVHGQRVGDDYRVALLDDELYWPDGQVKGEVYEYGSFVQSRMFAEGVTCSDCHDPHRPELRTSGDRVCAKCHAERYFTAQHHFHREGSDGARCVSCHMPAATFMVVDRRHDHSLRVPRPDLSVKLGVPNPCTGCHHDRPAEWAARTVERWYGHAPAGWQRFAEALAAGRDGAPGAARLLGALVEEGSQPAIARATAIERMERQLTPDSLRAIRHALEDASDLVRRAAVHALAGLDPELRARLLGPRLGDGVRSVRIEAASALAGVPRETLSQSERDQLERATDELIAAQRLDADRPEAHLTLARLHLEQHRLPEAEGELKQALAIDPAFVPAAVNLADLYRLTGTDGEGEPILRTALAHAPEAPALLHALGLWMVRQQRMDEATALLGTAARLAPANPRFGYVHGVALHDLGRDREALRRLEAVVARHPYDRDSLTALESFHRQRGETREAQKYAARLAALDAP
jgi:Flp pilus assembly protein TadD